MKCKERHIIERCGSSKGETYGRIELTNIAKPETMIVILDEQRLIPEKFDIYGWPLFSNEVCDIFEWKQEKMIRQFGENYRLYAVVEYEIAEFDFEKDEIDTLDGIQNAITDLKKLNELLTKRRIFNKKYSNVKHFIGLRNFVIFGKYRLDNFGQIQTFGGTGDVTNIPDVCTESQFKDLYFQQNPEHGLTWFYNNNIPKEGESCCCCTLGFSIDDVKNLEFGRVNGKIVHKDCENKYEYEREINRIINRLVTYVYEKDFTFECIPNGYCNQSCCAHKPWFLCHTPDGDIEIGWRKRVISIEWKENFKSFNMSIFDNENVTKWNRGIHAWGEDKAFEYLERVKNAVSTSN